MKAPTWQAYSDEAMAQAKAEGRPVIIDFKADWCVACKELEAFTFSDDRVLKLGQDFVWLYFDATKGSDELNKLRERYSIVGLPFVAFHDKNGRWQEELTVTGFENADKFLVRMQKAVKESP